MYRRILTVTVVVVGVLAAGGAALAVANSVSTAPEPAFISHLDKSITDHATPNTIDDHGNDRATPSTTDDSTPNTVDDHGNDANRGPGTTEAGDDHRGPSANSGPGRTDDRGHGHDDTPATTPVTVDDHGHDTTPTTPGTVDDHGHDGSGKDSSGSGSRHSDG